MAKNRRGLYAKPIRHRRCYVTPTYPSGLVVKDIPGNPGYKADSEGHIWGIKGYRLKWRYTKGYPSVTIRGPSCTNNNNKKYVHQLVPLTFHGPKPDGLECRHLDGDKNNPRPDNLLWGTAEENQADARKHGADIINAKLSRDMAEKIRHLRASGVKVTDIAKHYGVTPSNIYYILRGDTWK